MAINGDSVQLLVEEFFRPLNPTLDYIFAAGVIYGAKNLLRFALSFLRGIRIYFIPFGRYSRRDITEEFGKWAVVIGATSGIGLAYAKEFARRGVNVVLISKSYDDLLQIVSDIQSSYSVQALGIHADFSLGAGVFQEIEDALIGYEIGILVNTVAISYDHPQYFALVPQQRLWQLINVNIAATTIMTHMLLPQMLQRRKGAIINICSHAACTPPIPLNTAYTATMAYMANFSQTLHFENQHRGIVVQTLLPSFVAREGVTPSLFTPHPSTYVTHAIATLGVSTWTCGYWPHGLQSWLCCFIPRWLWVKGTSYLSRIKRKQCLLQAIERKDRHIFTRRRHRSSAVPRGISELNLRRSPSPHRRISTAENSLLSPAPARISAIEGSVQSPGPIRRSPADPLRRVSREENGVFSPSRTSSSGSVGSRFSIPPIPESPVTPHPPRSGSPSGAMFASGSPLAATTTADGGMIFPPRRTSSASSVEQGMLVRRYSLPKRHSRVLVVPSVARVSMSPEKPHEKHSSGHDHEGDPKPPPSQH